MMADQPLSEEVLQARFGGSTFVLEKARHLRDGVFPRAGVTLYIQEQLADAVTSEPAIGPVALLETLGRMTDAECIDLIERGVEAHENRSRLTQRDVLVE